MFTLGSVFALANRHRVVSQKPNPFGPSAWATVAFALIFWASVTWMVWKAPDWMLCYFVPAATMPMYTIHALFALCLVLAGTAGHTMTSVLLQRGSTIGAWSIFGSGALVFVGLWAITFDRYIALGSFAEFMNGQTTPIHQSTLAGAMNTIGIIQGISIGAIILWLYTDGKRLKAR